MAKWTGWHYDHANGRLGMYYKGHLAAYLNENGITGVDVDAGFGGGVSDPLVIGAVEASDYLSVGASPAASGAIRLSDGDYIATARTRYIGIGTEGTEADWVQLDPDNFGVHLGGSGDDWAIELYQGGTFRGDLYIIALDATVDDPIHDSPVLYLQGSYFAETPLSAVGYIKTVIPDNNHHYLEVSNGSSSIYFDNDGAFRPPGDNELSLGKAGASWSDLYVNHLTGIEVSDPSAPAANSGVLYFRDNGGKTELVARFPTGAIQQLAIEP